MATLVFSAVGRALGGRVGAAVGGLVGRQLDGLLLAPGARDGARLSDLAVTASSYGAAVPRVLGRMRLGGTIIWATDLKESSHRSGGGKGRPVQTSYSYSASFAVALASCPLAGVGRIWADGVLLRGSAGDLNVTVKIQPHPLLRREGSLIICDLPLGLTQAAVGCQIDVPTLEGRVEMKIPAGTQSGAGRSRGRSGTGPLRSPRRRSRRGSPGTVLSGG